MAEFARRVSGLSALTEATFALQSEFGLTPIVAAEIECYVLLPDESQQSMDMFWQPVHKAFLHEGVPVLRIEKERGYSQYEIITAMTETPLQQAHALARIKSIIEKYGARTNTEVSFAAKPFAQQPSSGLHLHVHLSDMNGINAYHKREEWMSDALRWSLGGLLANMANDMPIFFPTIEDHARLSDDDHVPKIFGWGVNNRYCALRIPAYPDPYDKRIEHRLACANADPYAAIGAVLGGIVRGLRERIEPSAQEYGKRSTRTVRQLALVG